MSQDDNNNNIKSQPNYIIYSEADSHKNNVKQNIQNILLYALSLATALGLNDLVLTIFDSFQLDNHIIAKSTYFIIMLGVTVVLAYYFGSTVKSG
jgi:hypothetical protein